MEHPDLPAAAAHALAARGAPFALVSAFAPPVRGRCHVHAHTQVEVVLHAAGAGSSTLADGTCVRFAPGDVTLYAPRVAHDQVNDRPGRDLCLHLEVGALAARLPPVQAIPGHLPPGLASEFTDLVQGGRGDPAARLAGDHRATAILLRLLAHARATAGGDGRLAEAAKRHLEERLARPVRLADAARALGVGEDHLRHVFTRAVGLSPVAWLARARVERARDLLLHTTLDLEGVAGACGLGNARYLCTVFKRVAGVTPGQVRRQGAAASE